MSGSANRGGYIRGPWWKYLDEDATKVRRCFVVAWGDVVRDPKSEYTTEQTVRFLIKTGRGANRNEKHLVCVARGESVASFIMRAIEYGDFVLCFGTWVEKAYKNKKGEKKLVYEMQVSICITQALVGFLYDLFSNPQAQKMIQDREDEHADVWEGD